MGRIDAYEDNVKRLYPELMKLVEDEEMADAACALCTALTIRAFMEGYSLSALLWLTEGSLRNGWSELKKWGIPEEIAPKPNGEIKEGTDE